MTELHRHYRDLILTSDRNDALRDNVEELIHIRRELVLARTRVSEQPLQLTIGIALALVGVAGSNVHDPSLALAFTIVFGAASIALLGWSFRQARAKSAAAAAEHRAEDAALTRDQATRSRNRHFATLGDAGLLYRTALDIRQLLVDRGEFVDPVTQNAVDGSRLRVEILLQNYRTERDTLDDTSQPRWFPELAADDLDTLIQHASVYLGRGSEGQQKDPHDEANVSDPNSA